MEQLLIQDWLEVLERFYLRDFIRDGGAGFKLVLCPTAEDAALALGRLETLCRQSGYLYVRVSAAETRVDRIEQIFFEVARQIDWTALMEKDAEAFLHAQGYTRPDGARLCDVARIAQVNGTTDDDLRTELRRATRREIMQDRQMCKEFRTALAHLRNAQFFPRNVTPSDAETLTGWLRGEKVGLSALRDLEVYSRIGRHNARDMLRALAHWLAKSGNVGLVIGFDLSALLVDRRDGAQTRGYTHYYTRNAVLDAYEVLREFIDETDELEHCLICAAAPVHLETDEMRGLGRYNALRTRLINEAHDRRRENPLAAMVHVSSGRGGEERMANA